MSAEVKIIQPLGRLDVTSVAKFRREVNEIAVAKPNYLVIDLSDVNFMDSSGLGALVSALKAIRNVGGEMAICALNEQVQMLFELTSMSKIFKVYASVDEFKASLGL